MRVRARAHAGGAFLTRAGCASGARSRHAQASETDPPLLMRKRHLHSVAVFVPQFRVNDSAGQRLINTEGRFVQHLGEPGSC